jgi:lysine-N-methylase
MPLPIRQLPVLQNWDCHVCGNCCKEYQVAISDEEKQRIEAQGWENDPVIGKEPLFDRRGLLGSGQVQLHRRPDGSCVFLSDEGRCRIHEQFGPEAKPLFCRLYPFVLVPAGDHWRVGVRFACPSAAANKGRALKGHDDSLREYARLLARREGMDGAEDMPVPPALQGAVRVAWPDVLRFVGALQTLLRNRADRLERRLRKCLALADLCRKSRFDQVTGTRLGEFLDILSTSLDREAPAEATALPSPTWVGKVLFRQATAVFARKDHGPNRGLAARGRLALLAAAWRFALGYGTVPRVDARLPETTFEQLEMPCGPLPPAAEEVLERYYLLKVGSLQFSGRRNFGLPFWEGFDMLALTLPIILWLTRALRELPQPQAVEVAVSMVDDHFGFNPILGTLRQRLSFRILSVRGELPRLIAWYSR